jgi:acyl-CoA synthetase (AMP-forming)/AMP-acid ligase II
MSDTAGVENAFDRVDPSAPGFNIAEVLEHWARVQPETVAVARADGRGPDGRSRFSERTFAELDAESARWAQAMRRAGVHPGDRVLIFIVDPIDFFTAVFACNKAQAVWVLIDPGMGVKNLLECVAEQQPTALLGIAKAQLLARIFRKPFSSLKARLLVGGGWFPGARSLTKLVEKLPEDARNAPLSREQRDPADAQAILYTSGSTGVPKGVVFTNTMMGTQFGAIRKQFDWGPPEAHVACFPPFAMIAATLGMSAIVPEMDPARPAATDPERVRDALDAYEAKSAFASPALWEPFSRWCEEHGAKFPHVTKLTTAGAPVPPALHERLLAALPNGDVFTPYGATEALPIAGIGARQVLAETADDTRAGKGTCVGQPVDGMVVKVIEISDEPIERFREDLELPRGEMGELIVKAPWISKRYDQRPRHNELSKMISEDDRWYHRMGDIGWIDEQGRVWFCGRKSHRVVDGERRWFSVPVEAVFEEHARVRRAALAWLGERPSQTPVVCVELESGVLDDALRAELRALAEAHAHTQDIELFLAHESFPVDRRHNAKIEREKLAAWASAQLSGKREAA